MKEKRREPATIISLFNIQNLEDVAGILNRLEEGFDVNTVDLGGRTLLMQATIDRNHTLMKLLLQEGADPNVEDTRNWTALHFAAQNYDLPAAKS